MKFQKNIFLVIFVKINLTVITVFGLKPSVPGDIICTQAYSIQESHYVPYIETYKQKTWGIFYETKVRVNYRIEYSTQWRTKDVCCDGYEEILGVCYPICKPECKNGECVLPNTCTCNPGYEELLSAEDYVCHPVCKQSCGHGTCVGPDTCICDDGYSTEHDGITCQPDCATACQSINAFCSAPHTCTCNPGYRKVDGPTEMCEPVCERPCVNGVCIMPDLCECNIGYEQAGDDPFTCNPFCENTCVFGSCIAPNTCECYAGYELISAHICQPVCSNPCVMGICVAPEICDCYEGYGLTGDSTHVCQPICERICVNGTCVAPYQCQCEPGFQLGNVDDVQEICIPYCEEDCGPYGQCTAPNTCTCFEGYAPQGGSVSNDQTFHSYLDNVVCKPVCKEGCVNGFCVGPNECACNVGYTSLSNNETHKCIPVCDIDCGPNKFCSEPNTCTCNDGYKMAMENLWWPDVNNCEPICEVPCEPAGTCTSPNTCTCYPGYRTARVNSSVVCEAICEKECVNGFCVRPNVCNCHEGFALDEEGTCVAVCEPPCSNGTCAEPNVCQCFDGYANFGNGSSCQPVCRNGCKNGECVAPDECQCNAGFRMVGNNDTAVECVNACSPRCKVHGSCVDAEGTCECDYGFEGENCEDPSVCSAWVFQDEFPADVTILDQVNESVVDAYIFSPYCFDCVKELNNQTICFRYDLTNSDSGNQLIRCIINKDLPCNTAAEYHPLKTVAAVTGIVGGIALLIMVVAFGAAYILLQRSRRRDLERIRSQNANTREPLGTESLLSEETVPL